jgi:hypothetical protein
MNKLEADKGQIFRQTNIDHIKIGTDEDYTKPLTTFFQQRAQRIRH